MIEAERRKIRANGEAQKFEPEIYEARRIDRGARGFVFPARFFSSGKK
jgi:hypothetical protein